MAQQQQHWLAWVLATIGIVGAGFAARLHRLIWALFWAVAVIWLLLCWWGGSKYHGDEQFLWWLLAIGPTVVVAIIFRIVEGVVLGVLGGLSSLADTSASTSRQDGSGLK